jgi:hypothetical protein
MDIFTSILFLGHYVLPFNITNYIQYGYTYYFIYEFSIVVKL